MPATPIVVETGSGDNPAANSYVSQAEATQYALDRGVTLSTGDAGAALIYRAMDYLAQFTNLWKGDPTQPGVQPLDWPRAGVTINGTELADNIIPSQLKNAQMQLAIEAMNGPLMASSTGGSFVTREKVGPIETEYSEAVSTSGVPYFSTVDMWLSALLESVPQPVRFIRA